MRSARVCACHFPRHHYYRELKLKIPPAGWLPRGIPKPQDSKTWSLLLAAVNTPRELLERSSNTSDRRDLLSHRGASIVTPPLVCKHNVTLEVRTPYQNNRGLVSTCIKICCRAVVVAYRGSKAGMTTESVHHLADLKDPSRLYA